MSKSYGHTILEIVRSDIAKSLLASKVIVDNPAHYRLLYDRLNSNGSYVQVWQSVITGRVIQVSCDDVYNILCPAVIRA